MSLVTTELHAKDVMTRDPVCIALSSTTRELARLSDVHQRSGTPVIATCAHAVGGVTTTDLIRRCTRGTADMPSACLAEGAGDPQDDDIGSAVAREPSDCVDDFTTQDPLMVRPQLSASTAARWMHEDRVHQVIMGHDDSYPIGISTRVGLLAAPSRS